MSSEDEQQQLPTKKTNVSPLNPLSQGSTRDSATNPNFNETRMERTRILLFVKILLRCLEKKESQSHLICRVKAIVSTCVKRNKLHDDQFVPLGMVLETMLQGVVDESIWNEAKFYQQHYDKKRKLSKSGGSGVIGGGCYKRNQQLLQHRRQHKQNSMRLQQQLPYILDRASTTRTAPAQSGQPLRQGRGQEPGQLEEAIRAAPTSQLIQMMLDLEGVKRSHSR